MSTSVLSFAPIFESARRVGRCFPGVHKSWTTACSAPPLALGGYGCSLACTAAPCPTLYSCEKDPTKRALLDDLLAHRWMALINSNPADMAKWALSTIER